jgi:gliding motility-associated-like protein
MNAGFFIKFIAIFILYESWSMCLYAQTPNDRSPDDNIAPIIAATGNQTYCPQTHQKIVTDITITDPDDTAIDAVYIQITSGYVYGEDQLTLTGVHPNITTTWSATEGKLKLFNAAGNPVLYTDFIAAIKDVEFYNNSNNPHGIRNFSISIGQANYLPSNGHYYYYFPHLGISWTDAKIAAANTNYNGLQGYLATITAYDEAQLAGAQAAGAGWIGGSDSAVEGQWRWMTGPENGNLFTYTYWNTGEPNNLNDEDYAHVTAPGVGISGSWNDLRNTGEASGDYQPKGYIVEYGGMPGDPVLQLATSTTFTISEITQTTGATRCDIGTVTLQATASAGTIEWYDVATGGAVIFTGSSFTTPILNASHIYYVKTACGMVRTPVTATINVIPHITSTNTPVSRCGAGSVTLQATSTVGIINWYNAVDAVTPVASGTSLTLPNITEDTIYYVEAVNNTCTNGIRTPISIAIHAFPEVSNEEVFLCPSGTVNLDATLTGMSYLWSNGATSQQIVVSNPGLYTVDITNAQNCSKTKSITVIQQLSPDISQVQVVQDHVTIEVSNPQDYFEYSIDGNEYQSDPEFWNVPGGYQTVFVRNNSLCGLDMETIIVWATPKFFTPNADGYNDDWEVKGMEVFPNAEVVIFNRFGKPIYTLNATNPKWNGTYSDTPLPASDYWFSLKLDPSIPEIRGHFTLKR